MDQQYASSHPIQDEETRTDEVEDDHAAVCVRLIIELNLEITIVGWDVEVLLVS